MKRTYTQRRQQPRDPNWRKVVDTARCTRSRDGKHRWLTQYDPSVCEECLEIGEKGVST